MDQICNVYYKGRIKRKVLEREIQEKIIFPLEEMSPEDIGEATEFFIKKEFEGKILNPDNFFVYCYTIDSKDGIDTEAGWWHTEEDLLDEWI